MDTLAKAHVGSRDRVGGCSSAAVPMRAQTRMPAMAVVVSLQVGSAKTSTCAPVLARMLAQAMAAGTALARGSARESTC